MTRPKTSKAATLRQLCRILLVAMVLLSGGWSLAKAANENWDIYLTIDNFGTVYYGTSTQTVGGPVGISNWWPTEDHFVTTQPSNAYLYVATGSDHSVAQGFVGRFTNTTLGKTAWTGDPAWEVFPAGKYASDLGYDLDPATPTTPFAYVWGYVFPNIWQPSDLPNEAQWIWYESGLVPSGTYSTPHQGGNHQEFLVFRIAGDVAVPGSIPVLTEWGLMIFGVVLLGFISWVFLRRRKATG